MRDGKLSNKQNTIFNNKYHSEIDVERVVRESAQHMLCLCDGILFEIIKKEVYIQRPDL